MKRYLSINRERDVSHESESDCRRRFRVARNNRHAAIMRPVIIANSLRRQRILLVSSLQEHRGNWPARRGEEREREGREGEGRGTRGRFAQHRITGRHVIGRRPSRLVGTDELLREKEPRGGVRGDGQEAWIAGEKKGGRLGRAGGRSREVW